MDDDKLTSDHCDTLDLSKIVPVRTGIVDYSGPAPAFVDKPAPEPLVVDVGWAAGIVAIRFGRPMDEVLLTPEEARKVSGQLLNNSYLAEKWNLE